MSMNWFGRRDPDARGYFGAFGGRFVPETLVAPIEELEREYLAARAGSGVRGGARSAAARTTSAARRRSGKRGGSQRSCGGARVFLKREDLTHTGAHKINNALGQALLAARMGKTPHRRRDRRRPARRRDAPPPARCSASSASSTWAPRTCARQALNVFRMRLLGATVEGVDSGSRTLKDAINEAMRDWVAQRRRHLLPARLGARAASLSADGPRVPVGDRPRGAASRSSSRLAGCPTRSSPASAAAATPSASSTRSSTTRRAR